MFTLENLESLGLLRLYDIKYTSYEALRKLLDLYIEDIDETTPNDVSYVYSG